MKKKNGFTLIELLAVIVILGIILVIATTNVLKNIKDSKTKAKYIAAKEIVNIAEAYIAATNQCRNSKGIISCIDDEGNLEDSAYVTVLDLKNNDYLEDDVTNPATGENKWEKDEMENHRIIIFNDTPAQSGYDLQKILARSGYQFDNYAYVIYK